MRIAVIMAGGAGERFWPVSRQSRPKQLLRFDANATMLEASVNRIKPLIALEHIYIVTNAKLKQTVLQEVPGLVADNILCEPEGRSTTPCLAFAAAVAAKRYGNPTMAVLTADHVIRDSATFQRNVQAALQFAEDQDALVTFGIPPRTPATGFGYIEAGNEIQSTPEGAIYQVKRFREKPDLETAKKFLESGNFFWNSGMFSWKTEVFQQAVETLLPDVFAGIQEIAEAWDTSAANKVIARVFRNMPKISVDYGVMEKASNVFVVRAEFDWEDIGAWDALGKIHVADAMGNIVVGQCISVDSRGCVLYTSPDADAPLVVSLGANNLIVVATKDAVLVCSKEEAQRVKDIVALLRTKGLDKYL
jgi:mannose-1-phosphate guanylyltransferase